MRWLVACALLLSAIPLAAQQVEPSEPQIVLPPILMKVQDVTQEKIDTPLPADQPPALPDINVALPQAQNIKLGTAAYEIPVPLQGPSGGTISTQAKPATSFFSAGVIGVGSMNHVIGDITLYKLGEEPRFTIEFSHQRLDGYLEPSLPNHFWPAGAGFFNQTDALTGSLTYSSKSNFRFETNDSYRETENGLQGQSALYSSVNHRLISGGATAQYDQLSPFTFGASVKATSGDMTLGSPNPQNATTSSASELSVVPGLDLGLNLSKVSGRLSGFYGLTQNSGQTQFQKAGGTLTLNAELPLALTLNGSVGAQWDTSIGWALPFSLQLDGVYKDILSFRLYGGRRIAALDYYTLWNTYPFLDHGQILKTSLEWYGGLSSDWRFGKGLALQSAVELSDATAAILPTTLVTGTGLFDFTQGPATILGSSVGLSWNPQGPFSLRMGWKGHFFDPDKFMPVSSFNLSAELNAPTGRYGGALMGTMDLLQDPQLSPQMPDLSLSGYFRVSDGVTFDLNMKDLLSPLMSSGRKTWNVYTNPGFRVTVTTQISL